MSRDPGPGAPLSVTLVAGALQAAGGDVGLLATGDTADAESLLRTLWGHRVGQAGNPY